MFVVGEYRNGNFYGLCVKITGNISFFPTQKEAEDARIMMFTPAENVKFRVLQLVGV